MKNRIQYPNPQFIRHDWYDLNGQWDFYLGDFVSGTKITPANCPFDKTINVPYSYTFPAAGVTVKDYQPVVWYRRHFQISADQHKSYLLHFEAVDYQCDVWFNGHHVKHHRGGHTPFVIDVSPFIKEDNEIIVRVTDYNRTTQPIGKQKWKAENFLCWYTRTIWIWQNVWVEVTGRTYIKQLMMVPDVHQSMLKVDAQLNQDCSAKVKATIRFAGHVITTVTSVAKHGRVRFAIDVSDNSANFRLHYWSPADPELYDIDFTVTDVDKETDYVTSYFGMRSIESRGDQILLNDQAIYQKLVLNQGYYPDKGLTGSVSDYQNDLSKLKAMGFNGNRIHQHIESHRMLYLCDQMGVLAWAEFPSSFEFSPQMMTNMIEELPAFILKHINHPSVITYVLMNESWGVNEIAHNEAEQAFVDGLYHMTKAYDPSRLVIGNDGWEQTTTDICTVHDYNGNPQTLLASYQDRQQIASGSPSLTSGRRTFVDGYQRSGLPFILSEYGGIAYEANPGEKSWGYGKRLASKDEVVNKISDLTAAVSKIPHCCGFCYTQLTNVEQEVNGLLDYDHQYKFDPQKINQIMSAGQHYGFDFN